MIVFCVTRFREERKTGGQFQTTADSTYLPVANGEKPRGDEPEKVEECGEQKPLQEAASGKRVGRERDRRSQNDVKPQDGVIKRQGSLRTRHLRIRAAILRSDLQESEWHLGYLVGRELVADSFTKIVDGAAFERALQDLCIGVEASRPKSAGVGKPDQVGARVAVLIGASLLSGAAAVEEDTSNDELSWWWTLGLILMRVGAVYMSSKVVRRRGRDSCKSQSRAAAYVPQAGLEDLQALTSQSRAVQNDPYNKLHGRTVESWQSDGEEEPTRPVRLHTSDQLPRRRKKKNKEKREHQSAEDENLVVDQQWRHLMRTTGNLHGATSSMTARRQSGSRSAVAASSSQIMSAPSGSQALAPASSPLNITSPSGSHAADAATSCNFITA
eukprot:s562_g40.t1